MKNGRDCASFDRMLGGKEGSETCEGALRILIGWSDSRSLTHGRKVACCESVADSARKQKKRINNTALDGRSFEMHACYSSERRKLNNHRN